jgi:small-conductance mechanosensitive channel
MTRNQILRMFVAALVALGACLVLLMAAGGAAISGSVLIQRGTDVVGVRPGPLLGLAIGLGIPAVLLGLASVVLSLVAWVGALVDTGRRPEKTLFIALLVVGVLGMLLVADLVYVLATGNEVDRAGLAGRRGAETPEPVHR